MVKWMVSGSVIDTSGRWLYNAWLVLNDGLWWVDGEWMASGWRVDGEWMVIELWLMVDG